MTDKKAPPSYNQLISMLNSVIESLGPPQKGYSDLYFRRRNRYLKALQCALGVDHLGHATHKDDNA